MSLSKTTAKLLRRDALQLAYAAAHGLVSQTGPAMITGGLLQMDMCRREVRTSDIDIVVMNPPGVSLMEQVADSQLVRDMGATLLISDAASNAHKYNNIVMPVTDVVEVRFAGALVQIIGVFPAEGTVFESAFLRTIETYPLNVAQVGDIVTAFGSHRIRTPENLRWFRGVDPIKITDEETNHPVAVYNFTEKYLQYYPQKEFKWDTTILEDHGVLRPKSFRQSDSPF